MYVYKGVVTYVVDGDTIDVEIDLGFKISTKQRLRLARIDTPERGQEGYQEAKDFVTNCVLNKEVLINTEKVSKFGYYLAEVIVQAKNLSDMLLDGKLARPYHGEKK